MTIISSTAVRPLSTGRASPLAIPSSSSSPQHLLVPLRRPINPPPTRLDFEPVTTIIHSTKKQRNVVYGENETDQTESTLRRRFPPTVEALQSPIPISLRKSSSSIASTLQPVSPCDEISPRDTNSLVGVVYMLHGWAQNVHVFSNRARKLTKRLNKAGYKVVFLQGPHRLPPIVATSTGAATVTTEDEDHQKFEGGNANSFSAFSREYAYAWFLYDNPCESDIDRDRNHSDNFKSPVLEPSPTGDFRGMDASLAFLRNQLRADRNELRKFRTGHQDGGSAAIAPFFLLGFSQGAVLVHKIATLACGSGNGDACNGIGDTCSDVWSEVRKCILVSGFSFTTSIHNNESITIYNSSDTDSNQTKKRQSPVTATGKSTIPSFHVVGRKDSRVSPHLTLELYQLETCFCGSDTQKILWEHDRGHVLPQDREFCNRLLKFLAGP